MGTSTGGAASAPSTDDISAICATSAPSADDIYLSISYCLRRLISGIMSHVKWSKWLSLFREKSNKNRESRNLVIMTRCSNTLLSCNRKLQYWWRSSMKFTCYIQMIQGTTVGLRCNSQWWIIDTSSARHTQETHPVRIAINQRGEQTLNKDAKTSDV